MVDYIHRFKRIPSSTSGREGFPVNTYKKRFGSMNNALKQYGLPTRIRIGYDTEFHFPDGSIYFVGKNGMGYEEIYRIMTKKCDILAVLSIPLVLGFMLMVAMADEIMKAIFIPELLLIDLFK